MQMAYPNNFQSFNPIHQPIKMLQLEIDRRDLDPSVQSDWLADCSVCSLQPIGLSVCNQANPIERDNGPFSLSAILPKCQKYTWARRARKSRTGTPWKILPWEGLKRAKYACFTSAREWRFVLKLAQCQTQLSTLFFSRSRAKTSSRKLCSDYEM